MAFDGRHEEADGPGEARPESGLRQPGTGRDGAGEAIETRSREEYYRVLRTADDGAAPDGGGGEAHGADGRGDGQGQPADTEEDRSESADAEQGPHGQKADRSKDEQTPAGDAANDADRPDDAWDTVDAEERPPLDDIRVTEERKKHILDGDDTGGGHRHGTGKPGKTEFPANWDDEKVLDMARDVARHPDEPPVHQDNGRWFTTGKREDVEIVAIVEPDAQIWTGWPLEGGPGVVKNPKET